MELRVSVAYKDYFNGERQRVDEHTVEGFDDVQSHSHGYFVIGDVDGRVFMYPINNVVKVGIQ